MNISFKEIIEDVFTSNNIIEATSLVKKNGKSETIELKNVSNDKTYSIRFKNDTKDSGAYTIMISTSDNKLYYESFYVPEFQTIGDVEFAIEQYILFAIGIK